MQIFYSPSHNGFFCSEYGSIPEDAIEITSEVHEEFLAGKDGYEMKPDENGIPSWVILEPISNSILLSNTINELSKKYKSDIYDLNTAYLAAIVNDGPSEVTKQQIVREQITQRKAQYVADIAAAKEKYPV